MCIIIVSPSPEFADIQSAEQLQHLFPNVKVADYMEDYCKHADGEVDLKQCLCGTDWETIFEEQGVEFKLDENDPWGWAYITSPFPIDKTTYPSI